MPGTSAVPEIEIVAPLVQRTDAASERSAPLLSDRPMKQKASAGLRPVTLNSHDVMCESWPASPSSE